nr:immunoglobulin heavy chain junction region [Mus musculus]
CVRGGYGKRYFDYW